MTHVVRYMRIEENAMDHPKFIAISANAWRLWCEGGTYCQKHLTDGFIPSSALKGFRYYSPASLKQLLAELVPGKGPLWHQAEGGIQVHDYLQWNEPREKVLAERQKSKDRYERWKARSSGAPSAANGAGNAAAEAETTGLNRTEQTKGVLQKPQNTRARSHGLMAGSRPIEHGDCLVHGPVCLKPQVASKYLGRFGNDEAKLKAWANRVSERWQARIDAGIQPEHGDDFKFWGAAYDEDFGAGHSDRRQPVRTVPDADQTAAYLDRHRRSAGR